MTTTTNEQITYDKAFFNAANGIIYPTLKKAKSSSLKASIYRCWMANGEIVAMHFVYGFGEQVSTISNADQIIKHALELGTVGKSNNPIDKRIV